MIMLEVKNSWIINSLIKRCSTHGVHKMDINKHDRLLLWYYAILTFKKYIFEKVGVSLLVPIFQNRF